MKKKIALLIDSENVGYRVIKAIVKIAEKEGDVVIKRVYGGYGSIALCKEAVLNLGFQIRTLFPYAKGKNNADILLSIDAMDILFNDSIDIFMIASSDSDFSSLVLRLKEGGKRVTGFLREESTWPYINTFSDYYLINDLEKTPKLKHSVNPNKMPSLTQIRELLYIKALREPNGILIKAVRDIIKDVYPSFKVRYYNVRSSKELIEKFVSYFEISEDKKYYKIKK